VGVVVVVVVVVVIVVVVVVVVVIVIIKLRTRFINKKTDIAQLKFRIRVASATYPGRH